MFQQKTRFGMKSQINFHLRQRKKRKKVQVFDSFKSNLNIFVASFPIQQSACILFKNTNKSSQG